MTKKILAFLCVAVLLLSTLSLASAEGTHMTMKGVKQNVIGYESSFYTLKNGKTATFYVHADYMSSLYPKGGTDWTSYRDILFDCEGKVKASCSAKWVHITKTKGGFILYYDSNQTQKDRKATIKVTGNNYSAKFVLIQYGKNDFTSVVRNKKTVTFKFKMADSAKGGYLSIWRYKYDEDGAQISKSEQIEFAKGTTSLKYKVQAGWYYDFSLYAYYPISSSFNISNNTAWAWDDVTSENINEKEQIYPRV